MQPMQAWADLIRRLGAEADPAPAFRRLAARYGEPGRRYHVLDHVLACVAELDGVRGLCARPLVLELALWYHDAVHDPRAPDNETMSAVFLWDEALTLGINPEAAGEAAALVRATDHSVQPPAGLADALLVRDIDLAILGRPPQEFAAYDSAIRAEYGFLSRDEWRAGRRRVLEGFLARLAIYSTGVMQARYEDQARVNITAALARLSLP
jgi:predicted metal-dependent HD superfamily phosphohydrolase